MPNYVQNILNVTGKKHEISKCKKILKGMDFEKICPMPKTLNVNSGTTTDIAVLCYIACEVGVTDEKLLNHPDKEYIFGILNYLMEFRKSSYKEVLENSVKRVSILPTAKKIKEEFEFYTKPQTMIETQQDMYILGKICYENYKKYGAIDWYAWRNRNWGNKMESRK